MSKKSSGMVGGKIVIDASDWLERYQELEPNMADDDSIIRLAQ